MKISFLGIALITVICIIFCSAFFWNNSEVDREKIADALTDKIAKKICQEKSLHLVGTGGGMLHGVRMMGMSFYYYNEVDLKSARQLVIYCTEEYLKAINSDKRIRPFLVNYPFTDKNVQIRIFFRKPDGRNLPDGKITVAASMNGIVDYDIHKPGIHGLSTLQEEPYEEARKIVAAEN